LDHDSAPSSAGPRRSGRVREVRGGKVPTSRHLTGHVGSLEEVLMSEDSGSVHFRTADTSAAAAGVQRSALKSQPHHSNPDRGQRRARSEPFSDRSEELLDQLDADMPHSPQKQQQPPQRRSSPPLPPPQSSPGHLLDSQDSLQPGALAQGLPSQHRSSDRKRSSRHEDSAGERETGGQRSSRNRNDPSSPMQARPSTGSSNTSPHRPGTAGSRRDGRSAYSPAR